MSTDKSTISRKVLETYTRDIGRAVARIDFDTMGALGVSTGDIVQITGPHRSTVAKCMPLYPSDERKEIIRIDKTCRNNAGVVIGNSVTLQKIESTPAVKVLAVPLGAIPPIDERYLADALESIPVVVDDTVTVPYFGGKLSFKVVGVKPAGGAVIITQNTVFMIQEEPNTISVSIDEYVGQEPETDRAFVPVGAAEANKAKSDASTPFYLGFKLELSCGDIAERIDYQKKLAADEVGNVARLARKYKEITYTEVNNANKKLADDMTDIAVRVHEQNATIDGKNSLREVLHDLKYKIIMKWADAKAE